MIQFMLFMNLWMTYELYKVDESMNMMVENVHSGFLSPDTLFCTHDCEVLEKRYPSLEKIDSNEVCGAVNDTSAYSNLDFTHTFEGYHNTTSLVELLDGLVQFVCPTIASRITLGNSVQGRPLAGIQLGTPIAGRASLLYIANMAGDEVAGRELLLRLAYTLCSNYAGADAHTLYLLASSVIYIVPSMNPDGFEAGRRENANGIDLDRNFPDASFPSYATFAQPETEALMNFTASIRPTAILQLQGGAAVVRTTWGCTPNPPATYANPTTEGVLFTELASLYASLNPLLHQSETFPSGVVAGAAWFCIIGGYADYAYDHFHAIPLAVFVGNFFYGRFDRLY